MQKEKISPIIKAFLICAGFVLLNGMFSLIMAISIHFPVLPMLLAMSVYVVVFTIFTQSTFYNFIKHNSLFFKAVIIGYIVNALIVPVHFYAGIGAVTVAEEFFIDTKTAIATFLITGLQGVFLNITAVVSIGVIYYAMIIHKNYIKFRDSHAITQ